MPAMTNLFQPLREMKLSLGCIGLALLFFTSTVTACPTEKVRITFVIILASEKGKKVHPKLTCIAREVRKTYPQLTNFSKFKLHRVSLPVGKASSVPLVDKQKAKVTILHHAEDSSCIRLKIRPPMMREISYETVCEKFLPIVTPFRTSKKEWLILAVCVQPCRAQKK